MFHEAASRLKLYVSVRSSSIYKWKKLNTNQHSPLVDVHDKMQHSGYIFYSFMGPFLNTHACLIKGSIPVGSWILSTGPDGTSKEFSLRGH